MLEARERFECDRAEQLSPFAPRRPTRLSITADTIDRLKIFTEQR